MKRTIITAPRASALIYGLGAAHSEGIWLLPANVCPAVPLALAQAGARFEFIDITLNGLCMDVELARQRIADQSKPQISGLVYVRSYGHSANAQTDLAHLRTALPKGAVLIDDQCLSIPQTDLETLMPHGADAIIFSTGHAKVLDLSGGGYGVFFGDLAYHAPPPLSAEHAGHADKALTQRYKAAMAKRTPLFIGSEQTPITPWIESGEAPKWMALQASIKRKLPKTLAHKKALNLIYRDGLNGLSGLQPCPIEAQIWRYTVRVGRRDEFLKLLFKEGLFASAHYYPTSNLFGGGPCPIANAVYGDVLNLFNDLNFTKEQAEHVVSLAQDFYSQA